MATFGRLKAKTAGIIGSINVTDDATILGEWANEAVRDVLIKTGVKVTTGTVTLTANTNDYTLDAAVLLIKTAYLDGVTDHMLEQLAPAELLSRRIRDSTAASSDSPWFYALEGADLFRVYPTPSSAGTINITHVPKPTEMSSDAHDPASATYGGIPVEHHLALELYMLWRGADYTDDQSSGQGQRYHDLYEAEIRKIRKYVNAKGGTKLPRAKLGGRRWPASDPSTT